MQQALRIAAKDLRIEWRSREVFATMTFLAVVVVLIFSFAFVVEGRAAAGAGRRRASCGSRSSCRAPSRCRARSTASAKARRSGRCCSRPRPAAPIYLGKLAATVGLMLVTETVLTALCGVLFGARVDAMLGPGRAAAGARARSASPPSGCVFSAALLRARGRDALLATLLYPIIVPIVIAGARGTAQLLDRQAGSRGRAVLDAVPVRARHPVRHRRAVGVRARRRRRLIASKSRRPTAASSEQGLSD